MEIGNSPLLRIKFLTPLRRKLFHISYTKLSKLTGESLAEGAPYISSNVFEANFSFNKSIEGFDFYRVEGLGVGANKFRALGKVIAYLTERQKVPFASYTPSPKDSYVVGSLHGQPQAKKFEVDGLSVTYVGQDAILPTPAGMRALTELLNKSKARELRQLLWSPGGHTFYPKQGRNLNIDDWYKGCNLVMFRGPFFRYDVLSNGRIAVTLDSSTHYISAEPFSTEVRRKRGLDWFAKELEKERQFMYAHNREFKGIHFFYDLYKNDVTIDGFDERPISEILLPQPAIVNGIECKNVADYLKAKYNRHPDIRRLDSSLPGLKGGNYTYSPQFLYRTITQEQVPNRILNDLTYFIDRRPRAQRDNQRPATLRWEKTNEYFLKYNFQYVSVGPLTLKMNGPLKFPITNHFDKPKLRAKGNAPIKPENISKELSNGLYSSPRITRVYLYSVMNPEITKLFYETLVNYAKSAYNVTLPAQAIPLERDLLRMRNQLENSVSVQGIKGSFCIALIPTGSDLHDEVTNICGSLSVSSKCVTINVVEKVCLEGAKSYLKDTVASLIARAGGVPWILHDKLHYGCYVATDVGRSRSEYWAMSIVYDQEGKFAVEQGQLMTGEDLDEQSIKKLVAEALQYAPDSDTIIYLRDGEAYEKEREFFAKVIEGLPYSKAAIVSIKGTVPFRIYRTLNQKVVKPLSGDYYFLDEKYAALCAAGGEIYEHGTPKPIVAEVIPIKGLFDMKLVLEDVFRLCFLNWGSPGRSYSVPAPVRMAHELASELSSGIRRYGSPF